MADDKFSDEQAKIVDALLLQAVEQADYQRIDLCLQKGADIDTRNDRGRTPLMMAVWLDNPTLVQFLLARQPSLFLKDNSNKNAFDLLANVSDVTKRQKITNILLQALPDHVRKRTSNPVEAAALAEAEVAVQPANDTGNVATATDITVSKPLVLPARHPPKGFSL